MQSYLHIANSENIAPNFSLEDLGAMLKREKIIYGIHLEQLKNICENAQKIEYPVLIAEGKQAINGTDAYLQDEILNTQTTDKKKLNFREVLNIPSVKEGQLLATIIPPTQGINGMDVYGRPLIARPGKPLKIRAGKNVLLKDNQFFSTSNGQISVTNRMMSVNPVFEVRGDIDLKTGNINFIGTVIIRGEVPTGYEIKAGGDIQIGGIVDGAYLEAGGNITVRGGIAGCKRGKIIAGGNIQAAYLNQADVKAGQDVIIESSLLHSEVQAKGSIICQSGPIIGGKLWAGKNIKAKEIGNRLFTKTDLYIGFDPQLEELEQNILTEKQRISANLKKLNEFEHKLADVIKLKGSITNEQKQLLQKQNATIIQLQKEWNNLNEQLNEIEEEKLLKSNAYIIVTETVYPNTTIHNGKYSRMIQKKHIYSKFYLQDGDILFEPIG